MTLPCLPRWLHPRMWCMVHRFVRGWPLHGFVTDQGGDSASQSCPSPGLFATMSPHLTLPPTLPPTTPTGKFSEELVRNYTRQLLLGLQYLHGSKVVHRDLKGGNVLVTRDGVVKLAGRLHI